MQRTVSIIGIAVLSGIVGGLLSTCALLRWKAHDRASLIAEFYAVENAVHVSPHSLRKKIAEGKSDYILVDLRSAEEYEKEHVVGAVNIPAYKDKDHSDYGAVDRIVTSFKELPKDKDIIVYCYSIPCMTGRKVGQMLAERGIYVQHLGIGWNEWRHFWTLWNHEHEWSNTKALEYVSSGKDPGTFKGTPIITPCSEGGLGC